MILVQESTNLKIINDVRNHCNRPDYFLQLHFTVQLRECFTSIQYTRKNAQLAWTWLSWQAWTWLSWLAWTWLSWPAWTVLLTGLFMHVGTDCSWLDERTDLNNVVGTIMINQQPCSCMIEHVVRKRWNNKTEQRCYNNYGCCIKSGFACFKIREQPLSIHQAVYTICWNMIEQYCYFTNTVLSY